MINFQPKVFFTTYPIKEDELRLETDEIDLEQFSFIFGNYFLSKDFMRELIGRLNHCERLNFENDILWSAKIVRMLSPAYLQNAVTFLSECKIEFFVTEFEQYRAIDKFRYRIKNPRYAFLREREVVSYVDEKGCITEQLVF